MNLGLLKESISIAWKAMVTNRLRAVLSLISVMVGIFLVVAIFTAVDSIEKSIKSGLSELGDNVVYIQKMPWAPEGDEYEWWKYMRRPDITIRDFERLRPRVNSAGAIAFMGFTSRTVETTTSSSSGVQVMAISHEYETVREFGLEKGRYFTRFESEAGVAFCILGASVADVLFDGEDVIGRQVKVGGRRVKVIGVITREGDSMLGNSLDNALLIPAQFAPTIFNIDRLQTLIMARAREGVNVQLMKDELIGAFRGVRGLAPAEEENFALNEVSVFANGLEQTMGILSSVGFVLAAFALLVGGFGIANIMFVSVRERTKIIGIQKALGAKRGFILSQFLFESIFLCLIGGGIGVGLVILFGVILNAASDYDVFITFGNILIGVITASIIGLIFGLIPAFMAARLNPVDAIRAS